MSHCRFHNCILILDVKQEGTPQGETSQQHGAVNSPIEQFYQSRNDQSVDGKVIKTRRIVLKQKARSPQIVISSTDNSPNPHINPSLSDRFSDTAGRREDR